MKHTRMLLSVPMFLTLIASANAEQLSGGELKGKAFTGTNPFQSPFSSVLVSAKKQQSLVSLTPKLQTGSKVSEKTASQITVLDPDVSTLYSAPGTDASAFKNMAVGFSDPHLNDSKFHQ